MGASTFSPQGLNILSTWLGQLLDAASTTSRRGLNILFSKCFDNLFSKYLNILFSKCFDNLFSKCLNILSTVLETKKARKFIFGLIPKMECKKGNLIHNKRVLQRTGADNNVGRTIAFTHFECIAAGRQGWYTEHNFAFGSTRNNRRWSNGAV